MATGATDLRRSFDGLAGASQYADGPVTSHTRVGTPSAVVAAYEHNCGDVSGDGHIDAIDLVRLVDGFGTSTGDGK